MSPSDSAAARLASLGELPDGIAIATPAQIRAMVEGGVLPPHALDALADLSPTDDTGCDAAVAELLETAAQVLAACDGEAATVRMAVAAE